MTLTSTTEILQWLRENDGFADAKLSYELSAVNVLSFIIEYRLTAALAGEKELLKVISGEASNIEVLSGELAASEKDQPVYQIHALEDAVGLMLDIWGKDEISFTCAAIEIKEVKMIEQITPPVLSKDTLAFKIRMNEKPEATFWIEQLKRKGYEAVYIGYFGDVIPTREITDYAGISIRPKGESGGLPLGVKFCQVAALPNQIVELVVELQNSELDDFWKAFVRTISELEIMEVRSGNVVFTPGEWDVFLKTNKS